MARRKNKRGTTHTTSVLTALFALTPAALILTNTPSGAGSSPIGALLSGGGSWQSIQNFGWALAQNVIQNWVVIAILLLLIFGLVKITRRLGAGARITRHLRL